MVLTVNSIEGVAINEYAKLIGREWAIGGKNMKKGILIILVAEDKECYVEVGNGLFRPLCLEDYLINNVNFDESTVSAGTSFIWVNEDIITSDLVYGNRCIIKGDLDCGMARLYEIIMYNAHNLYAKNTIKWFLISFFAIIVSFFISDIIRTINWRYRGAPEFISTLERSNWSYLDDYRTNRH